MNTRSSLSEGSKNASAHTYRSALPTGASSISFNRFSSSVASGPAYRAERTPGRPSSAAASIPESSAIAGRPVADAAARALGNAFEVNVSPSSGGSSIPSGSGSTVRPVGASRRVTSANLWRLRVASTSGDRSADGRLIPGSARGSSAGGDGLVLVGAQTVDPDPGEREQLVEMSA